MELADQITLQTRINACRDATLDWNHATPRGREILRNDATVGLRRSTLSNYQNAYTFVVTTPYIGECAKVDAAGIAEMKLESPAKLAIAAMTIKAAPVKTAKPKVKAAKKPISALSAAKRDRGLAVARTSPKTNGNPKSRKAAANAVKVYDRKIAKLSA